MIISHRHKYIFTAIPKTGTHSVRRVLREHMGDADREQVGLFVQKRLPYAALAELGHGHISLTQVRPFVGEEKFATYLKFAFVRNPFDRFVSYCAFMTRDDGDFLRNPQEVMRFFLFKERPLDHLLFVPQHTFVCDPDGRLLADVVGRVENMQQSFDGICSRIGVPPAVLDKVNSSEHGTFREYYDRELIEGVSDFYRRDLELFGYSFEEVTA
ncbi:MAG: sulfotransferase family 2 domain-containing protein [Alphaproteobacteria bacterium]|nr:sulfotransferase family 2 domain-containing protein [Alphaproteobacteria bacterium]